MVSLNEDAPPAYESGTGSNSESLALSAKVGFVDQATAPSVLVTITPPREPLAGNEKKSPGFRAPVDICLVIDVSGSMDSEAPAPGEKEDERSGLTVLDVVKHAVKTIISTMRDDDRVAVVTFSDKAKIPVPLTYTTAAEKVKIIKEVEERQTEGSTNLWEGLKTGMNLICNADAPPAPPPQGSAPPPAKRSKIAPKAKTVEEEKPAAPPAPASPRLSAIFILTDGMPNVEPPRGHIPMLQSFLDSHRDKQFSISSFGFGYHLDSPLLMDIAKLGGGGFGFIPDAGMVGTVFVHAGANLYSTYAKCTLDVEIEEKIDGVLGNLNVIQSSWGAKIDVGDVQYGQEKDIVVRLKPGVAAEHVKITARYRPWNLEAAAPDLIAETSIAVAPAPTPCDADLKYQTYRSQFVTAVFDHLDAYTAKEKRQLAEPAPAISIVDQFKQLSQKIRTELANHKDAMTLCEDIEGQALLAVETEKYFQRWGRHYLFSLARSHQRQQCGNFKDPGLQIYGHDSPVFITSRDEMDKAFDALPPPVATPRSGHSWASSSGGAPRSAPKSMKAWNMSSNPCFAGHCLVTLADGSKMKVEDLKRGTILKTPHGARSVGAVLKTEIVGGTADICNIGDLQITPWHPIRHSGRWIFPADICQPATTSCDAVYSILLVPDSNPDAHGVWISDILCVTLGHGVLRAQKGDVRAHEFLGSYTKVLDSIRALPGFFDESGVARSDGVVRSMETGLITGFNPPEELSQEGLSTFSAVVVTN